MVGFMLDWYDDIISYNVIYVRYKLIYQTFAIALEAWDILGI